MWSAIADKVASAFKSSKSDESEGSDPSSEAVVKPVVEDIINMDQATTREPEYSGHYNSKSPGQGSYAGSPKKSEGRSPSKQSEAQEAVTPAKRGRGRPKGSGSAGITKKKTTTGTGRRGRPPGSGKKAAEAKPKAAAKAPSGRGRGRPPGSGKKAVAPASTAASSSPAKGRGRPKKTDSPAKSAGRPKKSEPPAKPVGKRGRPKGSTAAKKVVPPKKTAASTGKKRGRPPKAGGAAAKPIKKSTGTGKRGRPRKNALPAAAPSDVEEEPQSQGEDFEDNDNGAVSADEQ